MEVHELSTNFEDIFLDVRRSYRLLYLYQRRVMDLMKYISGRFGMPYDGGWSHFSNTSPRNGKGDLNLWAWDWLNMYQYEFHFKPKTIDGHLINFSIILVSDTGYHDSVTDTKTDIKSFLTPEQSETRLVFLAGKGAWHGDFSDFSQNFKKGAHDYIRSNDKGNLVTRSFSLTNFVDEKKTDIAIKGFVELCNLNGISDVNLI